MIIWINGAFGSGKTTCAYELHYRLPQSFVYDPENMGYFLNSNLPNIMQKDDFQDYDNWRLFNYQLLRSLAQNYEGTIIVPMTIINKKYYDEIIGQLSKEGVAINHFILSAQKSTLIRRLKKRLEFGNSWGKQHIDLCIHAFNQDICDQKILTDNMSIDEIVETIAVMSNLSLTKDRRKRARKWFDRNVIKVHHIRK